jgi:hypothetical protein
VVPSVGGWQDLSQCLEALEVNRRAVPMEILVVDRCGAELRERVVRRFPHVRLVPATRETPIPTLRARGLAAAEGEVVAVIEDHVLVPPDWATQVLAAQRQGDEVVGGSVSNQATGRIVDWAAFLCEYSEYLHPSSGPRVALTGNNVAYRRSLLQRYRTEIEAGRWEEHLHAALRRDGVTLSCRPEIRVGHKKHYTMREYLGQRYLYARSYAGLRLTTASWPTRIAYAAGACALPALLLFRIVARAGIKPGYRLPLLKSLPLIAVFVVAWAGGEMIGALAGTGDSLSRVS